MKRLPAEQSKSTCRALGALARVGASMLMAAFLLVASSCSPSTFFGKNSDSGVLNSTPYRKVNTSCASMQLSSSTLDVPTARSLLACFNSDGALEPIQKLFNRLTDSELEPLLALVNRHVLSDSHTLFQLERTYQDLLARGTLDQSLAQLGRLTENEEFVAALVVVLKDKYSSRYRGELLLALEELSKKLSAENVATGLDVGLTLAEARAFGGLQARFKGASPAGRELRDLTDRLLTYMGETQDPGHVQVGKELLRVVADYPVFEAIDTVTGDKPETLRAGISRAASFLKVAFAENGRIFNDLTSLFHYSHKQPIACLGGGKSVRDGALFLMGEMALDPARDASKFIREKGLMALVAMNPFCSYPPELGRYYPAVMDLADTSAMQPAGDLMTALHAIQDKKGDRPVAELLVRLLADTGSGSFGQPENTAGIKRLIPLLLELNERGVWDEVMILASLPRVEDRASIREAAAELVRPLPTLKGKSLYDVFTDAIGGSTPSHLFDLVHSLRRFMDAEEPLLVPALRSLRAGYYVNDSHPVVELVQNILGESTRNGALIDTLFRMADMPEFRESLRLVSVMSRDGRMRDLTGAVVTLFHRFSLEGQSEIRATEEPRFVPRRRHDLAVADLIPYPLVTMPSAGDPCRKLDLNLPMGDPNHPGFSDQLGNLMKCLNKGGRHQEWADAMDFLRGTRADDGRDLFTVQMDLIRTLGLTGDQMGYLADRWISAYDDGRFDRLMQALPMWVTRPIGSGEGAGPALEPLIRILQPIGAKALAPLRRLEDFGARVLRRDDIAQQIAFVDSLLERTPEPAEQADPQVYPMSRIENAVAAVECRKTDNAPDRAREVVTEYRHAVTGHDRPDGKPHWEWSFEDLQKGLEPVLDRLGWLDMRGPKGKRVYDAMLGLMRYFTLAPGNRPDRNRHYHPDDLLKWLRDRSVDYRLITYYYPGENFPRVRLVNTLDRLDLVLSNADFVAPVLGTNFGMKFLSEISDAWGDEPWEIWPKEIQDKFPSRDAKKLADVVSEIESTQSNFEGMVGYPVRPSCVTSPDVPSGGGWMPRMGAIKPRLYNIHQLLPVLRENAQNDGLRVLRDLFYELRYSTEERFRDTDDERNNLSLILKMIRMGVFRQLGRNLMLYSVDDPAWGALQDAFRGLIRGSVVPEMSPLVGKLINSKDTDHKLVWSIARQIHAGLGPNSSAGDFGRNANGRYLRQTGFYLLADGESLGLIPPFLKGMTSMIEGHGDYLTDRGEVLGAMLKLPMLSRAVRALYEDGDAAGKARLTQLLLDALADPQRAKDLLSVIRAVDEDPGARQSWELFVERAKILIESEDYQKLQLKEWVRDLLDFVEEKSIDPRGRQASRRLKTWVAERLESRDLDALLIAAQKHPKEVYGILTALGHSVENGEVKYLLDLVRRGLR